MHLPPAFLALTLTTLHYSPACTCPARDFFLIPDNYKSCKSVLVARFGELLRKIWNTRNFKGQVGSSVHYTDTQQQQHVRPSQHWLRDGSEPTELACLI